MSWLGVLGHDDVVERFRTALARGRLGHAYLFLGPAGIGKRTFALRLAQTLLCPTNPPAQMAPCGLCDDCAMVGAQSHPDLLLVSRPPDKAIIPLDLLIGSGENRMREGLCHDLGLKPFRGGRRVAVIDDADFFTVEGANCLLKTLEEPPPLSVLILVGTSTEKQLPTIRSRTQTVRFRALDPSNLESLLVSTGSVTSAGDARRVSALAEGSMGRALVLAEPGLAEFRSELLAWLASGPDRTGPMAARITGFVEESGREAALRRRRAKTVVEFTLDFFRELQRFQVGMALPSEPGMAEAVNRGRSAWRFGPASAQAALDRSLAALAHIDANAYQAAWLESWLDDLVQIVHHGWCQPLDLAAVGPLAGG